MTMFSHSRIAAYEDCPKKYEFAYVQRLPRTQEGIEAFMGTAVHDALEWLYGEVRACCLPSEEALVERYLERWESAPEDLRIVREGRSRDDYRAIGEKALREYYRRYHPFDQGTTVGLEMKVTVDLGDGVQMVGVIDRLVKTADGVWEIHDYKTSASLATQAKADADRQLALYELAVRQMYPDAERVTLVWHYVVFDHEVRSCRTPEQLQDLREQVLGSVRHIERQTTFPTRTSALCDWCEYRGVCPAWVDQARVAALPADEFATDSGVELVDAYMRTCDEVSALTARRDALREAIAARAEAEGLERLFGTEYAVKVFRYTGIALPEARDPRRAELEAVLDRHGVLDEVSSLQPYLLSKAVEAGSLPAAAMADIEPYLTRTTGVKLYPRKVV